jgi:phosphoribosylglycinamide formyltransferase-1
MKNLVILISGAGSNMRAIVRASRRENWERRLGARVAMVISNRPEAGGLAWAREEGIATEVLDHKGFGSRETFDSALAQRIDRHTPALLVLAGFMRILSDGFVARYEARMVNVHPSLLPAFAGLNTHQRAIEAGCRFAGATVHRVIPALDAGPILAQAVVPVLPGDTPTSLAARVQAQEHVLYPAAIAALLAAMPAGLSESAVLPLATAP